MTLCIISHTEHYLDTDGTLLAWGSTVTEINHLLKITDHIIHIAPLHKGTAPPSSLAYANSSEIEFIPLVLSGGKGLKKLSIAWSALSNLRRIHKALKRVDVIQFRAPTGMGLYVLPYLKWVNTKPYWVKYAGNWVDPYMPVGNRLQKQWLLKQLEPETQVTYNGNWEDKPQFLPFDNPCFTKENYVEANSALTIKPDPKDEGWTLCFVGALNAHKGVSLILETLSLLDTSIPIKLLHFIGDGPDRQAYEQKASEIETPIQFHGFLPKTMVHQLLSESHALLLPSKSEGFPKVVGEAMAYGCVPIVSKVSCLEDYIIDGENGYLLDELSSEALGDCLKCLHQLTAIELKSLRLKNYTFAQRFTYEYYTQAINEKIIHVRLR
jgi:glycosyltransferase involved in cell wall biosynthesis